MEDEKEEAHRFVPGKPGENKSLEDQHVYQKVKSRMRKRGLD